MSILVIEDEENLASTLKLNLELEGYTCLLANKGVEALKLFNGNHTQLQLVILDVMLPEINGFDLFERFQEINSQVPVIFLTAKNQSSDKITGLKLGAQDYITKPFDLEELLLRVKNTIQRNSKTNEVKTFSFKNGTINFETFIITTYKKESLTLSKREIGLLKLLTTNATKVISRDEIIETLWTVNENPSARTIDNYILNFRKYFEPDSKQPQHFFSIRGVGYKFVG
jgi:two-component system, OmpR family, alkaline phosphatase synthesis response regulator PhoP